MVLRRKSLGAANGRPSSQPVDRRPTRSRLSGTSTLTESRRINDSEFDVLPERTPSSASIELDITGSASSRGDNSHSPCDQRVVDANSLHISESTVDSKEFSNLQTSTKSEIPHDDTSLPNGPPITDNNANSRKYASHLYNGDV